MKRGRPCHPVGRSDGNVYRSLTVAAQENNCKHYNISKAIQDPTKTVNGFYWCKLTPVIKKAHDFKEFG